MSNLNRSSPFQPEVNKGTTLLERDKVNGPTASGNSGSASRARKPSSDSDSSVVSNRNQRSRSPKRKKAMGKTTEDRGQPGLPPPAKIARYNGTRNSSDSDSSSDGGVTEVPVIATGSFFAETSKDPSPDPGGSDVPLKLPKPVPLVPNRPAKPPPVARTVTLPLPIPSSPRTPWKPEADSKVKPSGDIKSTETKCSPQDPLPIRLKSNSWLCGAGDRATSGETEANDCQFVKEVYGSNRRSISVPGTLQSLPLILIDLVTSAVKNSLVVHSMTVTSTKSSARLSFPAIVPQHLGSETYEDMGFFGLDSGEWILSKDGENKPAVTETKLLEEILDLIGDATETKTLVFNSALGLNQFKILTKRNGLWSKFQATCKGWLDVKRSLFTHLFGRSWLKYFTPTAEGIERLIPAGTESDSKDVLSALGVLGSKAIAQSTLRMTPQWVMESNLIAVHAGTAVYRHGNKKTVLVTNIYAFNRRTGHCINVELEPQGCVTPDEAAVQGYALGPSGTWTFRGRNCVPPLAAITRLTDFLQDENSKRPSILFTLSFSEVLLPLLHLASYHQVACKFLNYVDGISEAGAVLRWKNRGGEFATIEDQLKFYRNMKGAKYPEAPEAKDACRMVQIALDMLKIVQKNEEDSPVGRFRPIGNTARQWHGPDIAQLLCEAGIVDFAESAGLLSLQRALRKVVGKRKISVRLKVNALLTREEDDFLVLPHPLAEVHFEPRTVRGSEDGIFDVRLSFNEVKMDVEAGTVIGILIRTGKSKRVVKTERVETEGEIFDVEILDEVGDDSEDEQNSPECCPIPKLVRKDNSTGALANKSGKQRLVVKEDLFQKAPDSRGRKQAKKETVEVSSDSEVEILSPSEDKNLAKSKDHAARKVRLDRDPDVAMLSGEDFPIDTKDERSDSIEIVEALNPQETPAPREKTNERMLIGTDNLEVALKDPPSIQRIRANIRVQKVDLDKYLMLSDYEGFIDLIQTLETWISIQGHDLDSSVGEDLMFTLAGTGHEDLDAIKNGLIKDEALDSADSVRESLATQFPVFDVLLDDVKLRLVSHLFYLMFATREPADKVPDEGTSETSNEKRSEKDERFAQGSQNASTIPTVSKPDQVQHEPSKQSKSGCASNHSESPKDAKTLEEPRMKSKDNSPDDHDDDESHPDETCATVSDSSSSFRSVCSAQDFSAHQVKSSEGKKSASEASDELPPRSNASRLHANAAIQDRDRSNHSSISSSSNTHRSSSTSSCIRSKVDRDRLRRYREKIRCKFYLSGTCKFGSKCEFRHAR